MNTGFQGTSLYKEKRPLFILFSYRPEFTFFSSDHIKKHDSVFSVVFSGYFVSKRGFIFGNEVRDCIFKIFVGNVQGISFLGMCLEKWYGLRVVTSARFKCENLLLRINTKLDMCRIVHFFKHFLLKVTPLVLMKISGDLLTEISTICNPITREFREDMNKAILDSFGSGEEKSFGTPDGKDFPDYKVKVTPLANSGNTVGIAKIYFGDDFVVSNISIKKTGEGKLFASMPSFKTTQVDENGKPVYKDIAFPSTKEFNNQLQKDILIAYHEAVRCKERDSKSIQDRLSEGQSKSADTLVSGMNDRSVADPVRDTVIA